MVEYNKINCKLTRFWLGVEGGVKITSPPPPPQEKYVKNGKKIGRPQVCLVFLLNKI